MAQVKVGALLAMDHRARDNYGMVGHTTIHGGANWVGVAGNSTDETFGGHGLWVELAEYHGSEYLGDTVWVRQFNGPLRPITQLIQLPYRLSYAELAKRGFSLVG